ncbi:MAG: hypothetical protein ABID40_01700 [Candidatus Bipolaricaulota bacterium]
MALIVTPGQYLLGTTANRRRKLDGEFTAPPPALTGADQLGNLLPIVFTPPTENIWILNFRIWCGVGSAGPATDANNRYAFRLYNTVSTQFLTAAAQSTFGADIAAGTAYAIPVNQNQSVVSGQGLALQLDIYDTGAPASNLAAIYDITSGRILWEMDYRPQF